MRSSRSRALKTLFSPDKFALFLLGSIAVSFLCSSLYQLVTNWLGTETFVAVSVATGSAALILFTLKVIQFQFDLEDFEARVDDRQPEKKKGLILMLSRADRDRAPRSLPDTTIAYHRPVLRNIWVVHCKDTLDLALDIQEDLEKENIKVRIHKLADVHAPTEVAEIVSGIYQSLSQFNLAEDDVISDYTGMTKGASVGMVLACAGRDRPLQYMPRDADLHNKPPIEIVLDYEPVERKQAADQP